MIDSYTKQCNQLQGDYKETFDLINVYVGTLRLDDVTREENMSGLLDIFLSAQKAEKPIEEVVGANVEQFCKNFCEGYGLKSRLLNFADYLRGISIIIFAICALEFVGLIMEASYGESVDFWNYTGGLNMTGYVLGLAFAFATLVGWFSDAILSRVMFRIKKLARKTIRVIEIVICIASFFMVFYFLQIDSSILKRCPLWILIGMSGIYLIVYHVLNRERLKNKKRVKSKFWDLVQENVANDFPKEMENKFQKKKARYAKKGKPELTKEKFLNQEEKDTDKVIKLKCVYYFSPFIFAGISALCVDQGEGFEHTSDRFWFFGIVFIVIFVIYMGIWKIVKQAVEGRREWITRERQILEDDIKK